LVSFDWGHADVIRQRSIGALNHIGPRCGTIRGLGSAVLALAYVAAGWLDAYFNLDLKPWDTAAATLLVAEAGGACRGLSGQPYHVGQPACLATNGYLGPGLVELLRESSLEHPSDD
jgi:myo-inositol-1(or 4)-monophosphatase